MEADALHFHDWLIYLLARVWHMQWYFDPRPWIRYRQHGRNEIGARSGVNSLIRRIRLIRSGWYKRQVSAALDIYKACGALDDVVSKFSEIFERNDSARRRFAVSYYVFRHGRRSLVDRLVLTCAAIAGWI
jgi:rhamnosyltransferase